MKFISPVPLLAALLASCATLKHSPSPHECILAGLKQHDGIEVFFESSGCFHNRRYELQMTNTSDGIKVTGFDLSPQYHAAAAKKWDTNSRRPLLPVNLSPHDAIKIDRLFEFYRNKPHDGCTTKDTIKLVKHVGGKAVATESFIDGSCDTYDQKHLLTLPALIHRMEPKPRH